METLDITQVARLTGLTPRALRFYEARGLVAPLRTAAGRRHYGPGELQRLNVVVALKRAGFSLAEIARVTGRRQPDLARLVAARLAALDAQAVAIDTRRALLRTVQSRLARGESVDVATLCLLIDEGVDMTEKENWRDISARYLTDEAKADFAAARERLPADFDNQVYYAKWKDLGARIEAALPLDPTSDQARAFKAEWSALIQPFLGLATPAMRESARRMYDDMGAWKGQQRPPFSADALAFIKSVPGQSATG